MNYKFNIWENIKTKSLDDVANLILTNRKASEFFIDEWLYKLCGNKENSLSVLDFGCGIGRNSFGMAYYSDQWTITGYDNISMLEKATEYQIIKYNTPLLPINLTFNSMWNVLVNNKFDVIFCCLVLQHIYEEDLNQYLSDFKKMTKRLVVSGRRFNDDVMNGVNKNTWKILENNGFYPIQCNRNGLYSSCGDPNEHFSCVYDV